MWKRQEEIGWTFRIEIKLNKNYSVREFSRGKFFEKIVRSMGKTVQTSDDDSYGEWELYYFVPNYRITETSQKQNRLNIAKVNIDTNIMSKHLCREGHWEALALPRAPSYVYGNSTNSNGQQFPASAKTSHRKSFHHVAKWFHSMWFPLRRRWNAQLVQISFLANSHLISYRPVINLCARRFSRSQHLHLSPSNLIENLHQDELFSPHTKLLYDYTHSPSCNNLLLRLPDMYWFTYGYRRGENSRERVCAREENFGKCVPWQLLKS